MDWYELAVLPVAFGLVSCLIYKAEVLLWQRLTRRRNHDVGKVVHHWNPELERENKWLSKSNHLLARDLEAAKRRLPVVRREGKLEALEWCYFAARDAGYHELADEIEKKRKTT